MKRIALCSATLLALMSVANVAHAQLPKFDTTPGKWSYTTRTEIPGMGSIPMSFEQCVSQKDIDEGKNLSGQKDSGVNCKYSPPKVTGNRYVFTATCTGKDVPEPMVINYNMTATPTQNDTKMVMTGGYTTDMGGTMNMSTSAKRLGGG